MEELLRKIGISKQGSFDDGGEYYIAIKNSDEWGKYYSILEKKVDEEVLELISDQVNADIATLVYEIDDYQISLNANFEDDEYSVIIKEKKEEDEDEDVDEDY